MSNGRCTITPKEDSPTGFPSATFQNEDMGATVYPGAYSDSEGFVSNVDASKALLEGAQYVCEKAVETLESCMGDGAKEYPDARLNATSATSYTDTHRIQYNIFGEPQQSTSYTPLGVKKADHVALYNKTLK